MRNRKIIIIDDDKKSLGDFKEILVAIGHDPVVAIGDFLSVDTVIQDKPDVILMELRILCKNGFELTDTINRVFETRRISIIAMSDFFKEEFRCLLDLCGIKRWLKKPFQPFDVIWAIENEIGEGNRFCDRCGYIDCVCMLNRTQDLSQRKDPQANKKGRVVASEG